jgi:hypothetical protein
MRRLLQARRQDRDSEPGEEGIPGRGGGAVRKRGRDNVRNELGEGLARRPAPLSHQAITCLPITIGVRGERPGDEHGRRLDRQPALRGQAAAEPGMAMFQVLAQIVPDVARGLELTRNPGRVIGVHLLSITPGTDIGASGRGIAGEGPALVRGEPGAGKTRAAGLPGRARVAGVHVNP